MCLCVRPCMRKQSSLEARFLRHMELDAKYLRSLSCEDFTELFEITHFSKNL
jgi:hypothetical protein